MSTRCCPSEFELWPAVVGEPPRSEVLAHLSRCRTCQRRVQDRSREVAELRDLTSSPALAGMHPPEALGPGDRVAGTAPDVLTPDQAPLPRQRIGRYELLEVLGTGGQSIVFRARHPTLECDVAVKIMKGGTHSDAIVRQLRAEGRWLAELDHPHLARVLDSDIEGERPFLILEFIRGQNLVHARERLNWRDAVRITAEIASATAALHERRIVHLDLKPENVMLTSTGESKLIDFGLARPLSPQGLAEWPQGVAGGTPEYGAPELWSTNQTIDVRADIFGLGAILYYLLVGRPPRPSGELPLQMIDPTAAETGSLVTPEWPPHVDDDALARCPFKDELRAVCRRAIAANPDERYRTAAELERDLRRLLAPAPQWRRPLAAFLVVVGCGSIAAALAGPPTRLKLSIDLRPGQHSAATGRSARGVATRGFRLSAVVPLGRHPRLVIRCPSGRYFELRPVRTAVDAETETLAFPCRNQPAIDWREPGTYLVVLFLPATAGPPGERDALNWLEQLPAPVDLQSGDLIEFGDPTPERPLARLQGTSADMAAAVRWQREFLLAARLRAGQLSCIAFGVE